MNFKGLIWAGMISIILLSGCSAEDSAVSENKSADSGDRGNYEMNTKDADLTSSENESGGEEAPQASQAPTTTGTSSVAALTSDALNRKLIYTANITMKVNDYEKAQSAIRDLIHHSGGYIIEFRDNNTSSEQGGSFMIKVPAAGFNPFISQLETLDLIIPLSTSIIGKDVTEEYVDLASRLKAKQAVETRLLLFMESATTADGLLSFSNELARVQEEIERIKGRMNYLKQNVAFSTIELRVYQPNDNEAWIMNKKANSSGFERAWMAMNDSLQGLGKFFVELFVFLAGALPILVVLAVAAAPVLYYYWKQKKNEKI